MSASDKQIGGKHYATMPPGTQPWDVLKHWLTPEEYRGWQKGTAIVYLARERKKGGDMDIRKAMHHLERLVEEFDGEEKQDNDGWIEWNGGECPVPGGVPVIVRLRDGSQAGAEACDYRWNHRPDASDIVAYKVIG